MRDMFGRTAFPLAAAVAVVAIGMAPGAQADPPCTANGCPHGPANNAPPAANVTSPSYKDGYKTEHDFFAMPQNHAYLASEMANGYTAATACQAELLGGTPPPNPADWIAGCIDALHALGFKS